MELILPIEFLPVEEARPHYFSSDNHVPVASSARTSSIFPCVMNNERIRPVKRNRYLGFIIADRMSWRPMVADVLAPDHHVLSILVEIGDET